VILARRLTDTSIDPDANGAPLTSNSSLKSSASLMSSAFMYSHCKYILFCNNGDAVFFFFFFFYVVVFFFLFCRTSLRLLSDAEKRGKPPVR